MLVTLQKDFSMWDLPTNGWQTLVFRLRLRLAFPHTAPTDGLDNLISLNALPA